MSKLLIFLVLFQFAQLIISTTAEKKFRDKFDIISELDHHDDQLEVGVEEEEEDGNGHEVECPSWEIARECKTVVNVVAFGAVGDGVSDDTQAFVDAWNEGCSTLKALMLVPEGGRYLVNATTFCGPCADQFVIQIDGTIVAPNRSDSWVSSNRHTWFDFKNLTGVLFQGIGVLDGNGQDWWDESCKKNKSNACKKAPMAFTIESSSRVRIQGLTIRDAPQMNIVIARSDSVCVTGVRVSTPWSSPNTDGIHVTASTNVTLNNCEIGVGDDCISIVSGCANITMKNITCGPGHGISIGSLGKNNPTASVERVVLDTALIHNTSNGLRIKTWQGGSGSVNSVSFQNVHMVNVSYPIIIDQFYCDSKISCKNQSSAVAISQIKYTNISGTSNTLQAMKFACSDSVPCTNITLKDINLQRINTDCSDMVETYCNSVSGTCQGFIQPSAQCLISNSSEFPSPSSSYNDQIIIQLKEEAAEL